jgi:hypothetical protein
MGTLQGDNESGAFVPPMWFAALYSSIAGPDSLSVASSPLRAALATMVGWAAVVPLYLLPARGLARHMFEVPHQSRSRIPGTLIAVMRHVRLTPSTGAILTFALWSLIRNRRHLIIAVTYTGLGLAIGLMRPVSIGLRGGWLPDHPDAAVLMAPLVLMLTMVVGIRSVFKIPAELDANWPFRLSAPTPQQAGTATRLALMLIAILPVVAGLAAVGSIVGWSPEDVFFAAVFELAVGFLVIEWSVRNCVRIPFACDHSPAVNTVRSGWLVFLGVLIVFGFVGANIQEAAIRSMSGRLLYLGVTIGLVVILYLANVRGMKRLRIQFDEAPGDALSTLDLSEAIR